MTLLSKKLQELSARFGAAHRDEHALIVELNKRLERQDDHLRDELTAVIENHDARRAGLHELLQALSQRVGALPLVSRASDAHSASALGHAPETQAIDHAIDETEPLPVVLQRARRERDGFAHSPISETVPTH